MDIEQLKLILDALDGVTADAKQVIFVWFALKVIPYVVGVVGIFVAKAVAQKIISAIASCEENARRVKDAVIAAGIEPYCYSGILGSEWSQVLKKLGKKD